MIGFLAKLTQDCNNPHNMIVSKLQVPIEVEIGLEKLKDTLVRVSIIPIKSHKEQRSYEQLKLWFSIIESILNHYNEEINVTNKSAMHEYLKDKYLPTEYVRIGGRDYPQPKTISDKSDISMAEFSAIIDAIMADYRMEGVEFKTDQAIEY